MEYIGANEAIRETAPIPRHHVGLIPEIVVLKLKSNIDKWSCQQDHTDILNGDTDSAKREILVDCHQTTGLRLLDHQISLLDVFVRIRLLTFWRLSYQTSATSSSCYLAVNCGTAGRNPRVSTSSRQPSSGKCRCTCTARNSSSWKILFEMR